MFVMKIHHTKTSTLKIRCILIKLINFVLLSLTKVDQFGTFPGGWVGVSGDGWVGQIKIKDHLSQAEADNENPAA